MKQRQDYYYSISEFSALRPFLRKPFFALFIHWIFQGLLYMDRTERAFKLGFDLILTAIFGFLLGTMLSSLVSILLAFIIAHTLNFVLNSQIWVVYKHFRLVKHSQEKFESYLDDLSTRLTIESSIDFASAYGSFVRGEWGPYSDLDIRLIRKPGLMNGLKACIFAFRERWRAFRNKFPLDIFVFDSMNRVLEMKPDEVGRELTRSMSE